MIKLSLPKSENDINTILNNCNIFPGDILLLHSNITRWTISLLKAGIKNPLDYILNCLIKYLGEKGTLILPTFNFDFCEIGYFDYLNTSSKMGSLTQEALKNSFFIRTKHPIYSFSVCGYHADQFFNLENRGGTSKESPFALIHKYNGKICLIDLHDQDAMTFYHYVEDYLSVPYRYHKNFNGRYINFDGKSSLKSYSLYVRNLEKGVETYLSPAEKMFWENKLYIGDKPYLGSGFRSIEAQKFCSFVENIINKSAENVLFRKT